MVEGTSPGLANKLAGPIERLFEVHSSRIAQATGKVLEECNVKMEASLAQSIVGRLQSDMERHNGNTVQNVRQALDALNPNVNVTISGDEGKKELMKEVVNNMEGWTNSLQGHIAELKDLVNKVSQQIVTQTEKVDKHEDVVAAVEQTFRSTFDVINQRLSQLEPRLPQSLPGNQKGSAPELPPVHAMPPREKGLPQTLTAPPNEKGSIPHLPPVAPVQQKEEERAQDFSASLQEKHKEK